MKGWGFPYAEWPDDLKAEYAYNPGMAKQLLTDAVYPDGFKTNIVTEGTENLALLKIIKAYFAVVGIDMEIRTMDSADWVAFCRTNRKYDQMVNRHGAGALGMVSEPLNHLERFRVGFPANYSMVDDPVFESFYNRALTVSSIDEFRQIVRSANEYVARQHFADILSATEFVRFYPAVAEGLQRTVRRKLTIMSFCHSTWAGSGLTII